MIRHIICVVFFGVAIVTSGFIVETPETRAEAAKCNAEWRASIAKNYDLPALRLFLISTIKERPIVDNVDLRKATIADAWRLEGASLTCGKWSFNATTPESDDFEIVWMIEDIPDPKNGGGIWKMMTLQCRKHSKRSFDLVEAKYREEEYVTLCP